MEGSPEGSTELMALPRVICLCGWRGATGMYTRPSNSKPPPCTPYPGHSVAERPPDAPGGEQGQCAPAPWVPVSSSRCHSGLDPLGPAPEPLSQFT